MNEQQWQQLNAQLAGIEPPPGPNWWPLIWMLVGIAIAAVLLIIWVLRWRHKSGPNQTPAATAIQRLNRLRQAWQTGELESRQAAYQLATLLRLGLGLRQLDHTPPPPLAGQQPQWQATITLLQQIRYQPDSNAKLTEQTFSQIQQWLKHGITPC